MDGLSLDLLAELLPKWRWTFAHNLRGILSHQSIIGTSFMLASGDDTWLTLLRDNL